MKTEATSNSASAAVAVICVIAFMLIGGLVAIGVGGYYFVARKSEMARARAQEAMRTAEMAAMQAEAARRAEDALQAELAARDTSAAEVDPFIGRNGEAQAVAIVVTIDVNGTVSLDNGPVADDELTDALANAAKQARATSVTIRADPDCQFAHVVRVQEACVAAKITDIRFVTTD